MMVKRIVFCQKNQIPILEKRPIKAKLSRIIDTKQKFHFVNLIGFECDDLLITPICLSPKKREAKQTRDKDSIHFD